MLLDVVKSVWHRAGVHEENLALAAFRLLDGNHRRYGGQIVHVGVLMLIVGVTGSSLYNHKATFELAPGQSASIAGYSFTFRDKLEEIRESNYTAVRANLDYVETVRTIDLGFKKWTIGGKKGVLQPERRFYDKSEQMNAHVAIASSWRDDLYITLAGWESGGSPIAVQALINPLTSWIWTGGWFMTLGAIICLLPRLEPKTDMTVTEPVLAAVAPAPPQVRGKLAVERTARPLKRKVRQ
jgi:cytochrome c-type biogenesis protein CcmF